MCMSDERYKKYYYHPQRNQISSYLHILSIIASENFCISEDKAWQIIGESEVLDIICSDPDVAMSHDPEEWMVNIEAFLNR